MSFVSSVCESANVESKDEENGKTRNQKCNGYEIDVLFVFGRGTWATSTVRISGEGLEKIGIYQTLYLPLYRIR
eukprot:scaffold1831_cov266-Chaetoceros_neogracile.AAC.4